MLIVENISKFFSNKPVLKNISLKFEKKKIYAVIGASGHGKTVLIKCIIGLLNPEKGKVYYDGQNFFELEQKKKQEIRKKMGVVFQGNALFDSMTVEQNVGFPLNMFTNWDYNKKKKQINTILEKVNLPLINKKYPSELSGGMQKRTAIARAIVTEPDYIFFDEPNSGLDPYSASIINELIFQYVQENDVTCIVNTHDMKSVQTIANEIIFIDNGKVGWQGNLQELKKTGIEFKYIKEFVFGKTINTKK